MQEQLDSLDTKQLAALLNVKERTIRVWTAKKKIPYHKLGALVRFNRQEVLRWYHGNRVGPLPETVAS